MSHRPIVLFLYYSIDKQINRRYLFPGTGKGGDRPKGDLMVLMTKSRKLRELVGQAYSRAQIREGELLVVWNARVYLDGPLVVMESACPIFLDKIIEQLRIFGAGTPSAPGRLVWVRPCPNRAGRWRSGRPAGFPPAAAPELARRAP
jgi:hypothetical protein